MFNCLKGFELTGIDIDKILQLAPSPAYVVDLGRLRHNLAILDDVQRRSGAKILMALKAFAMWSVFPLIRETLASGRSGKRSGDECRWDCG